MLPPIPKDQTPPYLSIGAVPIFTGGAMSRTRLFDAIKNGDVLAFKIGRRTVVSTESLCAYIERQPRAAA